MGVNHVVTGRPGVTSCFTRIVASVKLWITSLLDRCTTTARFTGTTQHADEHEVVCAASSVRSMPSGIGGRDERARSVRPKRPSGPG